MNRTGRVPGVRKDPRGRALVSLRPSDRTIAETVFEAVLTAAGGGRVTATYADGLVIEIRAVSAADARRVVQVALAIDPSAHATVT